MRPLALLVLVLATGAFYLVQRLPMAATTKSTVRVTAVVVAILWALEALGARLALPG